MRYGPDDALWIVVDAKPDSQIEDVLFEASLRSLELQFKGGLGVDDHPTLFTDRKEAETEARARLLAMRVSQLIAACDDRAALRKASWVALLDSEGLPVFEAELPKVSH